MGNLLGLPEEDNEVGGGGQISALSPQQLDLMASRVKEVLPQVPLDVIRRDISQTANVDETITRLLDGTVSYQPLLVISEKEKTSPSLSSEAGATSSLPKQMSSNSLTSPSSLSSTTSSSRESNVSSSSSPSTPPSSSLNQSFPPLSTAASTFGKTPDERHTSFEERKRLLIEAAKQRYLAKHGLLLNQSKDGK